MIALAVVVGALVTVVEAGTTSALCVRVTSIGEGPGGIATVWGVQRDSSRGVRAALAEVRPGCANGPAPAAAGPAATVTVLQPATPASGPR